jgi:cytochrome c553
MWINVAARWCLAFVVLGCARPVAKRDSDSLGQDHQTRHLAVARDLDDSPRTRRFERPALVRFHMQRHFNDFLILERSLLAGDLDEAKAIAFLLTKPVKDPGMAPLEAESKGVVDAARAFMTAPTLDEASRREPLISRACANCHLRAQELPIFGIPVAAPQAQLARHRWAVERLSESMVGGVEEPWWRGLEVLAEAPLPSNPELASRLQLLARKQLEKRSPSSKLDDRANAFGRILATCVACHSTLPAQEFR